MLRAIAFFITAIGILSCNNEDYSPKPRAFHRIEFPQKDYKEIVVNGCPYHFEVPSYAILQDDSNFNANSCWKNLNFSRFNAKLHLTYSSISPSSTLEQLTEDAREFVFKHTVKASAIEQQQLDNSSKDIYGVGYDIKGNTASNYQFYVTDKKKHYLRGALYFNEKPNLDSIQPVLDFIKSDIAHLIHTISWK